MIQLDPISYEILEEIVQHLKSSYCCIDILPTGFFKSVFNCMTSDLLQIVQTSLRLFSTGLKTVVIKLFLKKRAI